MAVLTCGDLIDGVQQTQLNDVDKVTWGETELIAALNQALAMLIGVRPDASAKVAELACVSGTRQTLPDDGLRLLKVVRNIKTGGLAGRAVRLMNMNDLDSIAPDWHSEPEKDSIKEYMFDERSPIYRQIADQILYLASDRASTISGQAISVCGDMQMLA